MTTQKVALTCDAGTADGVLFAHGALRFVPSFTRLGDPADQVLIEQAPAHAVFDDSGTPPVIDLLPNDLIGPQQDDGSPGWTYTVYYDGCPGNPQPWSFYLLSTNGDTQSLSSLASTPAIAAGQQYVPLPASPPSSDSQVLGLSSDSPLATEWVDQTGGGGGGSGTVTSVAVESANGFAGTVADSTSTPQVTLKTTVNGMLKGNSTTGAVSAATAGTDYLAPAGSGAALTGITATQVGADASGAAAAALAAAEAYTDTETTRAEAAEALKAPLASPAFTGTPTAPTPSGADSSTKIATTAFVQAAAAAAASDAEAASDAAGSAATAEAAAESYADTNKLAKSADLSDVASAGTARANLGLGTAATHASTDFDATGAAASAQSAAEAYTDAETTRAEAAEALKAPLASPAFTGTPTAPTASALANSTQVATTAYADAAVSAEKTRALAAEALVAPLASPTFTGTVTVPSTVNATDAAQKAYVDSVAQGLDNKPSVTALAPSSITLSGTQTVDGVSLSAGNRVLATGQSTASQNGIWVVASGSWTRPADFASASTQLGASVFVEGGTSYGSSGWVLTGTSAVTVDSSSQTWTQFSGAGEINAGTGISKSGNTLSNTGVLSASAADTSVVAAGTASAPTFRTGTLDVIATQHPPVAAVPFNGQKGTGVANGSASTDIAAYGQTLAGGDGAPMTALGDMLYEGSSAPARLAGSTSATKQFLTQTGTGSASGAPAWGTLASGDIPNNAANTSGNAATATNLAGGATLPDYVAPAVVALSQSSGSVAVNAALGNAFNLTLTASGWTISNPTNAVDGQVIRFRLSQDSTGSRTVSWGSAYDFGAGSAPTLTTAASKVDIVAFEYVASISKWCCLGSGLGF